MDPAAVRTGREGLHGVWRWLRLACLPVLLLICLWRMDSIFDWLEAIFGLGFADLPIKLYATLAERVLVAAGAAIVFTLAILAGLMVRPSRYAYAAAALLATLSAMVLGALLNAPILAALGVGAVIALNAIPKPWIERLLGDRLGGRFASVALGGGVGVAEVLLPRPFWIWMRGDKSARAPGSERLPGALASWAPGIVVAAGLFSLAPSYGKLVKLGWLLNPSDGVERIYGTSYVSLSSADDIADILFDPKGRRIYLCGNGLAHVLALDVDTKDAPAEDTGMISAGAEFCRLDPVGRSFVAYNRDDDALLVWDLDDWHLRNSIPLELKNRGGGVFLASQPGSTLLVAASEMTRDNQPSTWALDIKTGARLAASAITPGYLVVDPGAMRAFVSFYTRETGILLLDLPSLNVIAHAPSDQRNDRMVIDSKRGDLLVASPLHGRVQVYDMQTLAPKPSFETSFGVRSLAVDSSRGLVATASLVSNFVDVIDRETNKRIKRVRVGPWLRNLAMDEACGRAFVASRHGVYRMQYADPGPDCTGQLASAASARLIDFPHQQD